LRYPAELLQKNKHLLGGLARLAVFAFFFFTPRRKDRKKNQKPNLDESELRGQF
jgi:hypothetical protein